MGTTPPQSPKSACKQKRLFILFSVCSHHVSSATGFKWILSTRCFVPECSKFFVSDDQQQNMIELIKHVQKVKFKKKIKRMVKQSELRKYVYIDEIGLVCLKTLTQSIK